MNAPSNTHYRYIQTHRIAGSGGAVVEGVDLSEDLPDDVLAEIRAALLDNCVIFFRDQKLTPERQLNFARRWGEIHLHPFMQGMEDYPEILEIIKVARGQEELWWLLAYRPDVLAAACDGHDALRTGGSVGRRRHDVHQPVSRLRKPVRRHEGAVRPASRPSASATISSSTVGNRARRATSAR